MIKRIKYKGGVGRPVISKTMEGIGRTLTTNYEIEILEGSVNGLKASAPEERWFRSVRKIPSVEESLFRLPIGAPRNLPGWKELDALHKKQGMYYAVEIDDDFTHRGKQNADVLHDAFVLQELRYLNLFPKVFHIDGRSELSSQEQSDETARNFFGV